MKKSQSILSSALGNILEWYDFGLFAIFSPLFSTLFFPKTNPHTALIETLSIFAIGFFCRPLGAIVFGYFGDTIGRAKTLRFSIFMISVPTLLIGCLPTYQTAGLAAPIMLTLIRMWQGISIGGEYSGNLIYLAETSPMKHRAFFTSFASTGANIGILLASMVGFLTTTLFTSSVLSLWAWRLPYLLSGLFSITIYFTRLQFRETPVFLTLKKEKRLAINPCKTVVTDDWRSLCIVLGLVCMGASYFYFLFVYFPTFLITTEHLTIHNISIMMTCFIITMILLVPMAGWLCDRIGRRKMFLFNTVAIAIVVVLGYKLVHFNMTFTLISALFLFTLTSSLEQGVTSVAVVENFPAKARYTGLSLAYNLGNGLLGGSTPFICEWLNLHAPFKLAPAVYIAFYACITGLVVYFCMPETKNSDLYE